MISKRAAVVSLAVMLLALAVPLASSDQGDAATADDVFVTLGDNVSSIDLSLNSGGTKTVYIYVHNKSDDYLHLSIMPLDSPDVGVETSLGVLTSESGYRVLYPAGDPKSYGIVTVSFTVDELADSHTVTDELELKFQALDDGSTFSVKVPVTLEIHSIFTSEGAYNKFFGIIPNTLPAPFNNPWVTSAVTLVLWILATIVMCELIIPLFAGLVKMKRSKDEKKALAHKLTKTISILMLVFAANECLNILGANANVMSSVGRISLALYVIIGAVLAWQIYVFIITSVLKGLDETVDVDGVDASLVPLFKMIGKLIICVMAAAIILAAYGVDLAGIMVSAGVITLGITFGAQQIISQFFSGIVLLATRPFKKGDFVNIAGATYQVHKVRLMYTEFENWDKDQTVTMPNNVVSAATLINYTKDSNSTRIFIYVDVAYSADLSKAKELMIRAAEMHPHVIHDGSVARPSTRLTNFADSGIEYRLACFVDDYDNSANYAGQIREIIYKLFLDNDIEIPYNRLQIDILSNCDGKKKETDTEPN